MKYTYQDEDEIRNGFWQIFPHLPDKKIRDYSGNGYMYPTDTRCAFVDWIDMLSKNNEISDELADNITLD